jgi:signal transduction histidine kinase/Tfp pilus assembly protein PilF
VYEKFQCLIKNWITPILLALLSVVCFAQNSRIDSLKNDLKGMSEVERYDQLILLMQESYKSNDLNASLDYSRQAGDIALQLGDSAKIVRCGRSQGQILNGLDRYKEAGEILSMALPIAKRNGYKSDYKSILNNLGIAYTFEAKYDEALKIHFETLVLREADNDHHEMINSLNNIGLVYFKLKNYSKAIEYYEKAYSLGEENSGLEQIESILVNIALCYNQLKEFEKAEKYFDRAFSICKTECSPQFQVEGKLGLGLALFGLKDYEKAEKFFQESLEVSKRIGNKRFQAETLLYLGKIRIVYEDWNNAIGALMECIKISKESIYNELLIEAYKELASVYNQKKEYQTASEFQGKYIHLKDSIYSEKLIENIAKVQTDYAERENIKTIASKETVIQQQRDLNVAIAVIAILAGLLILVLQRSNRISKQVNAQLSEAKATIQDQNKLLEIKNKDLDREVEKKTIDLERVNLSLKQVNDELDNFIYKTSHDIRGPLASLKGMCNVALLDVKDPIALDYLKKLDATAERLNSILTRLLIINQINNSKLSVSRIDFARIVEDVLMLEKKRGLPAKLTIRKNIDLGVQMFSDRELVRIVLENLIDNAIKFYNDSDRVDSFVDISIIPEGISSVKVRVVDNGIGISESNPGKLFQMFFRASERSEIGGIGLYIVKTATAKIGGKVGLLTTPEGYTEFYVVLPLNPPTVNEEWPDKPHL